MNKHTKQRKPLTQERNEAIKAAFWTRYNQLAGRHNAKTDVVLHELRSVYYLEVNHLRRIIFDKNL